MLAAIEHRDAIDEDIPHPLRQLVRLLEGGAVDDRLLVKYHDVGKGALPKDTPVSNREPVGHLRDYDPLLVYRGTRYHDVATNGDILDMMARQKGLNFPTGSQWQYSHANYVLLAMLVERVTGQSFREFAKTRIFEPLGMKSSLARR